jgi:hypothetical protein
MSLDLTHGFVAELHVSWFVASHIFAANFLTRHATSKTSVGDGRELSLWFDEPRLRLVGGDGPAAVEVDLFVTARLSDRIDQARIGFTARGPLVDRQVTVAGRTRACPSADFAGITVETLTMMMSTNPAYDDTVRGVVANLLRDESVSVGPLLPGAGKRFYRTYHNVPGHEQVGLLAAFVAPFGEPATPPGVDARLAATQDAILLVPDDFVRPAIDTGLAKAGLATMPAQLNPDVRVNSLDVSLQNGHIRIQGTATKTTDVLGIDIDTDFTFTAFVQPIVQDDGTIGIHVITTQQDLDDTLGDFADFITAGALTRLMEELVPAAFSGLSLGSVSGLDFLSDTAPSGESAPATPSSILDVFANGLGVSYDVALADPVEVEPPFIRGHRGSREFHIKGCAFGDLIAAANLVLFPTHQAALQAGYDGCATCQPEFSVAVFGDVNVLIAHPLDVEPGQPVTVRAVYASDIVRFGVLLAPEPEEIQDATPFDDEGMPTNSATFRNIVPAPWVVTVTCGAWSASETVDVHRRFKDATGTTQGSVTTVRGTVGQVGLAVE